VEVVNKSFVKELYNSFGFVERIRITIMIINDILNLKEILRNLKNKITKYMVKIQKIKYNSKK
jgi:hypothetical protein